MYRKIDLILTGHRMKTILCSIAETVMGHYWGIDPKSVGVKEKPWAKNWLTDLTQAS